ncbi:MAG: insulinase family protein [Planctomycetes bacterium]|nr:insulinase family protein [Planctomycetota bacterium]
MSADDFGSATGVARAGTAELRRWLESRVQEHLLDNGWCFLALPRGPAPVVAFHTYVGVGSIDEPEGLSGMAHMFEHMAFKGSERIGTRDWPAERAALEREEAAALRLERAQSNNRAPEVESARAELDAAVEESARLVAGEAFSRILEEAGGSGSLNASTSADETRYVVSLPADRLELWYWMERERFHRPVLREFYRERDAVREERRMRVESNPSGALYEALLGAAFERHPYRRPVIGYARDIDAYTRTRAEGFWRTRYGARRFTTCLVGALEPAQAFELARRYFGDLPAGPEPERIDARETEPRAERRVEVEFPATPRMFMAWNAVESGHPDAAAIEIAVRLLGYARSSRLEKRLVRRDRLATHVGVGTGTPGDRCAGLSFLSVLPVLPVERERIERVIDEELARLAEGGPAPEELDGVKTCARAEILRALQSAPGLAGVLAEYRGKRGDWRALLDDLDALERVDAAAVRAAVARYFPPTRRTVAWLVPAAPAAGACRA